MSLTQLLPVLEVIGNANKHIARVAKFLTKYGHMSLFPVKLQVRPYFPALSSSLLFIPYVFSQLFSQALFTIDFLLPSLPSSFILLSRSLLLLRLSYCTAVLSLRIV